MKIIDVVVAYPTLKRIAEAPSLPVSFSLRFLKVWNQTQIVNNQFTEEQAKQVKLFGVKGADNEYAVDPVKSELFEAVMKKYLHQETVMPDIVFPIDTLDSLIGLSLPEVKQIAWLFESGD